MPIEVYASYLRRKFIVEVNGEVDPSERLVIALSDGTEMWLRYEADWTRISKWTVDLALTSDSLTERLVEMGNHLPKDRILAVITKDQYAQLLVYAFDFRRNIHQVTDNRLRRGQKPYLWKSNLLENGAGGNAFPSNAAIRDVRVEKVPSD